DRRTGEAHHVADPPGRKAVTAAGAEVRIDRALVGAAGQALAVLGRHDPDEHTGGLAVEPTHRDAGALHRLPGGLEQQALLRVERVGLALRDPEEARVETRDVVEESRPVDVRPARPITARVV